MTSQGGTSPARSALLPTGWVIAVVVAVLAYAAKPEDELGFAIVVGGLAAAMAYWTYRSRGRVAAVVSVLLGVLWTLLFGGYAVANFLSDDEVDLLVRIADALAVIGGLMIVLGAIDRLRQARQAHRR